MVPSDESRKYISSPFFFLGLSSESESDPELSIDETELLPTFSSVSSSSEVGSLSEELVADLALLIVTAASSGL